MSPKKPATSKKSQPKSRTAAGKRARQLTETAAGGIVYKRTPQGVRLALIRDPYGKWTFPKGHQEKGESLRQAALRETREELGLGRLKLIRPLGRIEIWFRDRYRPDSKGALVHKYIHYFLMEAPARAKGQPQKKEKISRLTWVPPSQARRMNSYSDVRPLLDKAIGFLKSEKRRAAGRQSGKGQPKTAKAEPAPKPAEPRPKQAKAEPAPKPAEPRPKTTKAESAPKPAEPRPKQAKAQSAPKPAKAEPAPKPAKAQPKANRKPKSNTV